MNSALPWNINGVGIDARDAARDAARRQGKSLGEWLHGVIADHAEAQGSEPREIGGAERIEAVTTRLARLGARGSAPDARRPARSRGESLPSRRVVPLREDDYDDEEAFAPRSRGDRYARRDRHERDDGEDLLDKAVAELDRRAERAERRTGQALASMAKLIEDNQTRRNQEAGDVAALTKKLSELESNLTQRFATVAKNPLEGSLSRLEDRLEAITRRGTAEKTALLQSEHSDENERFRRFEDKLNTILAGLQAPKAGVSEASAPAMEAVRAAAAPTGRRSLGDAIAEIARRQRVLDEPATGSDRSSPTAAATRDPFDALRRDLAGLADKVEDMRRDASRSRQAPPEPQNGDLVTMRTELAAIARTVSELAPRGSIEALEGSIASLAQRIESSRPRIVEPVAIDPRAATGALEDELRRIAAKVDRLEGGDNAGLQQMRLQVSALAERLESGRDASQSAPTSVVHQVETIEQRLDLLAGRLDEALALGLPAAAPAPEPRNSDTHHLEALVGDLALRLEAAQAPGAGHAALSALQRQIEQLSERFSRSESDLSALPELGAAMRDLFAHLDETRASVETTAARAARDAIKFAAGEGRDTRVSDAEARNKATLDKVQDMLGKVVDRLGGVEREIADVRQQPTRAAEPFRIAEPSDRPVSAPVLGSRPKAPSSRPDAEIRLGGMEPRAGASAARMPRQVGQVSAMPDTSRRADFIAAARRAAATAQAEAAAVRRTPIETASRAGLVARSRDYVATHRRPVLMSLGALMLAVGTLVLVGRMSPSIGSGEEIAAVPAVQARVATLPDNRAQTAMVAPTADADALSPSASAATLTNPVPGIDPVQTGSIPSLPSFAAGSVAPRPTLPGGLVAAADRGDLGAQYSLAALYAEGRSVPRNMQQAIGLFQKAADAGSAPAAYRLGLIYEKGLGVTIDKVRANALYTRAAEAGNTRAMHNLAVLLADNEGHPDYAGAIIWFRKAAQYGVHDSQYNLGVLLGRGLGVPQNLVQSYQWFAVAAAANDADAARKRDEVALKMSADDLAVAKALVTSFKPRVADPAAIDVTPPPGGWDSAPAASRLNSARAKVSSL